LLSGHYFQGICNKLKNATERRYTVITMSMDNLGSDYLTLKPDIWDLYRDWGRICKLPRLPFLHLLNEREVVPIQSLHGDFFNFFYSYVHAMFVSFLPSSPHLLPFSPSPLSTPQPFTTRQKLFCLYL
jgi:hypothetical protein